MGEKEKWFEDKQQAAAKLWSDVGTNNVKIYDIQDYQQKVTAEVHPPKLLYKCTHVEVACSGDISSGRDWMLIAPYRVDENKNNEKCYDIDPTLFVLDTDSGTPHPSGVAAYHQKFMYRTTDISGFSESTHSETVQKLRDSLITGALPLASGSPQVLDALQFMQKNTANHSVLQGTMKSECTTEEFAQP